MLVTEEIIQTNFDILKFQDKDYLFSDIYQDEKLLKGTRR